MEHNGHTIRELQDGNRQQQIDCIVFGVRWGEAESLLKITEDFFISIFSCKNIGGDYQKKKSVSLPSIHGIYKSEKGVLVIEAIHTI